MAKVAPKAPPKPGLGVGGAGDLLMTRLPRGWSTDVLGPWVSHGHAEECPETLPVLIPRHMAEFLLLIFKASSPFIPIHCQVLRESEKRVSPSLT